MSALPRGRLRPLGRLHAKVAPSTTIAFLALWTLTQHVPATAHDILLLAEFDEQPLDEPIGTGGAALGQPVSVPWRLSAIVRDMPAASPNLEITWASPATSVNTVRFRWLDAVEVATGMASITLELQPGPPSRYTVDLRESTGSTASFGGLLLASSRWVYSTDANGLTALDSLRWSSDTPMKVTWEYDLDAGTYDLYIDGEQYLDDRPHGVVDDDRGLGSISIGFSSNSAPDARIHVDNIHVTHSDERIFDDGFEGP